MTLGRLFDGDLEAEVFQVAHEALGKLGVIAAVGLTIFATLLSNYSKRATAAVSWNVSGLRPACA